MSIVRNFFLCCLAASCANGQTITGFWKGAIASEQEGMKIFVDFKSDSSGITGLISYPDIGVSKIPVAQAQLAFPDLGFMVHDGSGQPQKFEGRVEGESITGTWRGYGMAVPFFLKRAQPEPISYQEEPVDIHHGEITLSGTFYHPQKDDKGLAVIVIHGSGDQTRELYRFYAELFAGKGISALIYDKRGCGKSTGDWRKADFNDLANDAVAAANYLRNRKDLNAIQIGFLGFSQGGWIAPLAATKFSEAAFVINVSGPAVTPREQEKALVEQLLPSLNLPVEEVKAFIEQRTIFEKSGKGWDDYWKSRAALEQKGVLNFIGAPDSKDSWLWDFYRKIFDYDPVPTWQKVKCPMLIIYGELDVLMPVEKSAKLAEQAFKEARKTNYSVKIFERANHGITYEPGKGGYQGFPRFATGYTDLLLSWVAALKS